METIHSIDLIYTDPTVRRGAPCIKGTTLRVLDVVMAMLFHQRTPDDLMGDYEVSAAGIHAALAYYYLNKSQIDEDIRNAIAEARNYKEQRVGSEPPFLFG